MIGSEQVVLLNEEGREIGTADKSSVHGRETPLHLAFSCYVFNAEGQVLIARRALLKKAWPGVWTNSFCGHPQPAETMLNAVRTRAAYELGMTLSEIELALPLFRYRATDAAGVVENEMCPVYLAVSASEPDPRPREVMETRWIEPLDLAESMRRTPWAFSPWMVLQAQLLPFLGGNAEATIEQRAGVPS
ncbi:isopentenyl-diphosphate Delta-isomerase [Leifsonia sp. Root112D2]|uniref:isopentenyl-diphosphate Delta-isomerase n=1 Tax=Leifsonia sp. Root112D2 TaxID=1736426 RepID=UPI0006F5633F|nr:isopentenyl-diphosphate Delta-isomerase [Leifsonia sp. Root112D2]KQV06607.1 isopentenyl-diphosphate delta-isomerase [Leifsonia sp. Root112D2]